jgi:very-short-patch-repair endonuclease
VGRLRTLVDADRNRTMTRSEAEELFLALIRRAGLPEPELNVRIGRWEVDYFFWRHERLAVEIDGHAYHSARTARERDHRKDAELQAAHCLVLRISARRLRREPEVVLVEVATALARRRAA